MIHFVVAFALLLHVWLWGAGVAMLTMPRPWRRFWPVLAIPAGLALQSAVVWIGAYAGLRGTNSYAWGCELLPVALLIVALRRPLVRPGDAMRDNLRAAWTDLNRFGVVAATMAGCLVLLVLPVAWASRGLNTISLGSCDAADYAAGARVLMEFARTDRDGFLGLTEVVRIASVDNFFDYWLQLNHFTPSALVAFNGTILGCAPHELTTLLTAVLLTGLLPTVFWISRAVLGYSGGVSVIVAGLFGLSPIPWYAFAHASPGQLLAAQAVAWLTWAGVALWRAQLSWKRGAQFAAVLAIGYWLVLGSYNFWVLICLVPALAHAGGLALWRRQWSRLVLWLGLVLLPLAGCALVFNGRVRGLAERLTLLQTYDFGWQIPALTAEGWLGMVRGPDLAAWSWLGLRWILSACVVGLLGWAFVRAVHQRRRGTWLVVAMTAPILAAYLYLQARGARLGTNASYDAYKLFAVFYPVMLPAFCWWVTLRRSRRLHEWLLVSGVAAVIVAFNLVGCAFFVWELHRAPLMVDGQLRQLRKIEAMPDVKSVNLLVPDMWSRLWANAFLLHKEQYFPTHTYEGRLNTPLRGDWDLQGGIVSLHLPDAGRRQIAPRFALVNTHDPRHVRVTLAEGWHVLEFGSEHAGQWQWTQQAATLRIENPQDRPLQLRCTLDARAVTPRDVSLGIEGSGREPSRLRISEQRARHTFPPVTIPMGVSTVTLRSHAPALPAGEGDPRPLALCVFDFAIEVLE